MPEPFVAYLRVYEPLSCFSSPKREQLASIVERGAVESASAGGREQDLWLRTQVTSPSKLLPGETLDGNATDEDDALVLAPEDVPSGPAATVGPGPLVCPLDLRGRSAAALVGFLTAAEVPLRAAVLDLPLEKARTRANAVVSELSGDAVHVLSSTWTVPLPWFALIDPDERVVEQSDATVRRVLWRTAMADARRRVARAHAAARESIGDEGPTKILKETGRWLERFHPHSAVELDYGGLVQMMTEVDVEADTSADDVHAIVDAMEAGRTGEVSERYESLRDFWAEFASRERFN
ncbi:hypothetical protein [Parasphingorhabdus pacifica]